MINEYEIKLRCQSKEPPNWFWGYNLYGALMQKLPPETIERLHASGLSPLSQYVMVDKASDILTWHVTVTGDISGEIEEVLSRTGEYTLEGHDARLVVLDYQKTAAKSHAGFARFYLHEAPASRRIRLSTMTPVSFKSGGEYVFFPTVELIYKSAVQKWNAFAESITIEDEEALGQLIGNTRIVSYRLGSFYYQIKGVKIPSFFGDITLFVKGPEALVRLADLLLHYLSSSGLGIKCALGMGGIKTVDCSAQSAQK